MTLELVHNVMDKTHDLGMKNIPFDHFLSVEKIVVITSVMNLFLQFLSHTI